MENIPGPDPFIIDDSDIPETPMTATRREPMSYVTRRRSAAFQSNDNLEPILIPGAKNPELFLPIPTADPLSSLLTKYVSNPALRPRRDTSGEWDHAEAHSLVLGGSWRALAQMARAQIVSSDREDAAFLLDLWVLRLTCLARMRLYNQVSSECGGLFSVLEATGPPTAKQRLLSSMVPFELEALRCRMRYWASDAYGYLDELSLLLVKCKQQWREASQPEIKSVWKERGARTSLMIASQLIEMKEIISASNVLKSINSYGSSELTSACGRVFLQAGHMDGARHCFSLVEQDATCPRELLQMNRSVLAIALGEHERAIAELEAIVKADAKSAIALNNLAVVLLSQGQLEQGIRVLERALNTSPAVVLTSEPFIFNLSTLYELRSTTSLQNKVELLIATAKLSGDGLKASALKLG